MGCVSYGQLRYTAYLAAETSSKSLETLSRTERGVLRVALKALRSPDNLTASEEESLTEARLKGLSERISDFPRCSSSLCGRIRNKLYEIFASPENSRSLKSQARGLTKLERAVTRELDSLESINTAISASVERAECPEVRHEIGERQGCINRDIEAWGGRSIAQYVGDPYLTGTGAAQVYIDKDYALSGKAEKAFKKVKEQIIRNLSKLRSPSFKLDELTELDVIKSTLPSHLEGEVDRLVSLMETFAELRPQIEIQKSLLLGICALS